MALPVLDGNQSATTLSSVVTSGEHIVAHSVVCFGSTAISNITNAVSGSVVSISNFPSTQTVTGTVTANLTIESFASNQGAIASDDGGDQPAFGVQLGYYDPTDGYKTVKPSQPLPISGTVTANLPALNWNTVKIAYGENTVWNGIYKKGASGYVDAEGGGTPEYLSVDGFFHGGTIAKLTRGTYPGGPLSFTGTRWYFEANGDVRFYSTTTATDLRVIADWTDSGGAGADVQIAPYSVEPVAIPGGVEIAFSSLGQAPSVVTNSNPFPVKVQNSVTIGSLPAISGAVTAAAPNGSLTTRFGTPTTANTAFATSAVTNTNRKYLLIQNVTTGSNVITVGIGFTPTTTQGIQLTAGAGITFESSYIPTGAVYVLSSVTASNFTILEA